MSDRHSRRDLLAAAGGAGVAATAGCLSWFRPSAPDCEGEQLTDLAPPARGAADAPVTVEVFSDFACPHCATFATERAPVLDDDVDAGRVRYVHRDFPIPVSDRSYPVANAARAVQYHADDAAFWTYADRLFANQDSFGTDALATHAEAVGVAPATVRDAVESQPFCELLKGERSAGTDRGVESTPTVFVDGEQYENPDRETLASAVRAALRE